MRLRFTIRDLLLVQLFGFLALLCFRWCYVFLCSNWFSRIVPVIVFSALGLVFLGAGLTTVAINPLTNRAVSLLVVIGAVSAAAMLAMFSYIL